MDAPNAIVLEAVSKHYGSGPQAVAALRAVDLKVPEAQFLSVMGASGSGKSTLLNLIAGIDRPTSGRLVVNGQDITQLSRTKLAYWRAANGGYIFQTHSLIPVLTAEENFEMPLLLLPLSRAERRKRIAIALEAVSLTVRADHYPRQLSGGQEQRQKNARTARGAFLSRLKRSRRASPRHTPISSDRGSGARF